MRLDMASWAFVALQHLRRSIISCNILNIEFDNKNNLFDSSFLEKLLIVELGRNKNTLNQSYCLLGLNHLGTFPLLLAKFVVGGLFVAATAAVVPEVSELVAGGVLELAIV